jgi:hypothetical protein
MSLRFHLVEWFFQRETNMGFRPGALDSYTLCGGSFFLRAEYSTAHFTVLNPSYGTPSREPRKRIPASVGCELLIWRRLPTDSDPDGQIRRDIPKFALRVVGC